MSDSANQDISADRPDEEVVFPPGDLPSEEPPPESDRHREQVDLLIRLLKLWWQERQDFYVSGNLTIYYSPQQKELADFRGPDFFVVLGTEKKDRSSWVVWQEDGQYPNVIVEILSEKTAEVDKGFKKELYQNTFRTPDYFWFDPIALELQGFHLVDGQYQDIEPTPEGRFWSQQLKLYLGTHEGKLRFFTAENELVPSAEELAEQESLRAQLAEERAQLAEERVKLTEREILRLRELLRAHGIDPETA